MVSITKILLDGCIVSIIASLWLMIILRVNPRIFLHDYPPEIQKKVPPKTDAEKRLSYWFGVPFILILLLGPFFSTLAVSTHGETQYGSLWLNAAGVMWIFNIVDWLILDWFVFCTLTPRFVVIPGSEGMPEYKDYRFHFLGFLKGTVFSILGGLLIAGIVFIL